MLLENLCPYCQREGYNGHCNSCGYFPEGGEWDGAITNTEKLKPVELPKIRGFNSNHPISERNQFIKYYLGNIKCGLFRVLKKENGNIVASFSIESSGKKHYFYVIIDSNAKIKGFSDNKDGDRYLLDAKGSPIRGPEYYRKHFKEYWVIEPFLGECNLLIKNTSAN